MSNFNPADWAIGVLRPGGPYPRDFGTVDIATSQDDPAIKLRRRLARSKRKLRIAEEELKTRRLNRLLLEAEASGRVVSLDPDKVEAEQLADFIEGSPECRATVNEETGELLLVCPDRETASLARLAL